MRQFLGKKSERFGGLPMDNPTNFYGFLTKIANCSINPYIQAREAKEKHISLLSNEHRIYIIFCKRSIEQIQIDKRCS